MVLILMIILACIIPIPIIVHHQDKLPQNLIEMVDRKEEEEQEEENAEIS